MNFRKPPPCVLGIFRAYFLPSTPMGMAALRIFFGVGVYYRPTWIPASSYRAGIIFRPERAGIGRRQKNHPRRTSLWGCGYLPTFGTDPQCPGIFLCAERPLRHRARLSIAIPHHLQTIESFWEIHVLPSRFPWPHPSYTSMVRISFERKDFRSRGRGRNSQNQPRYIARENEEAGHLVQAKHKI
jgi:hypothetical protein